MLIEPELGQRALGAVGPRPRDIGVREAREHEVAPVHSSAPFASSRSFHTSTQ